MEQKPVRLMKSMSGLFRSRPQRNTTPVVKITLSSLAWANEFFCSDFYGKTMRGKYLAWVALISTLDCSAAGVTQSVRSFSVQVELSKTALEVLRSRRETVVVSAEFADEIGPGGDYYGSSRYEIFKPGLVMNGEISVPSSTGQEKHADYEVNVNIYSGRKSLKNNVLNCNHIQGMLSDLLTRVNVARCDLSK
jgi:hypothetical protein